MCYLRNMGVMLFTKILFPVRSGFLNGCFVLFNGVGTRLGVLQGQAGRGEKQVDE